MQVLKLLIDWSELLSLFGVDAVVYAGMALIGTLLFGIRLAMMLLGFDSDGGDFGDGGLDGGGFPVFSLLAMTAFLMGGGFAGLAAQIEWGLGSGASACVAGGFGLVCMVFAAGLLSMMKRLDASPKTDPSTAIGRTASTYTRIPAAGGGTGQIRVEVSGRLNVHPAVSSGPAIEPFVDVRVVACRDDGTFTVGPIEQP